MGWRVIALCTLIACGRINFDPSEILLLRAHGVHSCVLSGDGALWCWGSGLEGQLGTPGNAINTLPRPIPGIPAMATMDIGEFTMFATSRQGELWVWGTNTSAQHGIGTISPRETPRAIPLLDVAQVAAGQFSTCARTSTGSVYCWGDNACGTLGDGTQTRQTSPQLVAGLVARTLTTHDRFACAIDDGGALRCWGMPLGEPCTNPTLVPTLVATLPAIVDVEGGCHVSACAVDVDGGVWCVGENAFGQLGDGTQSGTSGFVKVMGLGGAGPRIVEVAVGAFHACGRTADHRLWCWGNNDVGALGIGDPMVSFSTVPRLVPAFDGSIAIDDIEAGCGHSCVLSGTDVYCWGSNANGVVGDGTLDVRYAPVKVPLAI